MIDYEALYLVRDEMLTDPQVNYNWIWDITKIAEYDDVMYDLMMEWMKSTDYDNRSRFAQKISSRYYLYY